MKVYRLKVMIRTFVFILAFLELSSVMAAPGDTTWVTVFKDMKLDHHGNYDTTVSFPQGKRYRKIRMHYILGRYTCGGAQYCGSWDYTTKIYALPAALDTVEIARVITPYATNWHQTNKSHDYIVEVTDAFGCVSSSTVIVPADTRLLIPNIFTPNGDGVNDLFEIINLPVGGSHRLIISNRWGKEVFSANNYQEGNFWDAEGMPEGIYFYKLDVEGDQTYNGWVEIVRGSKP